jgi:hypothetical protein
MPERRLGVLVSVANAPKVAPELNEFARGEAAQSEFDELREWALRTPEEQAEGAS